MNHIDIVFSGEHESGLTFVEVEDPDRGSVKLGEWVKRDDGYWVLRLTTLDPNPWPESRSA